MCGVTMFVAAVYWKTVKAIVMKLWGQIGYGTGMIQLNLPDGSILQCGAERGLLRPVLITCRLEFWRPESIGFVEVNDSYLGGITSFEERLSCTKTIINKPNPLETSVSGRVSTSGLSVSRGGLCVVAALIHSASQSSADSNLLSLPSQPP